MTSQMKFIRNSFISVFFFSAILFISAGRVDYLQGWIYFFTTVVTAVMALVSGRNDPELINERAKPGQGVKSWDKMVLGVSSLALIATNIVAGLDSGRYGWSPDYPIAVNLIGVLLMVGGQVVFLAAKKENKFFSTVVRIQTDRGHTVCNTGIYRLVRHPGYLGMIISDIGIPFIFGSQWCTIPVLCVIVLLCIRTSLEDTTLKNELPGYTEYSRKTRYKLIPSVW